eukprot:CAMPEP_0177478744 /NCGR_PEP_ID=MMETSP0369-20130122/24866_1 /TAXON_ID=447022 ORGANISM="Scrippsiella hangoei-like, Strain SHHI-4" /NCGR_SAMPLE_ID=MMETSP0369 /ASSEMBLY_ACC=CAM_ASM_000364 /LENGTH=221 /DNA_ID=CAMNT_0018954227 /DNA_START=239 /DNA_END=901 /DNA_ORIENTATION=+
MPRLTSSTKRCANGRANLAKRSVQELERPGNDLEASGRVVAGTEGGGHGGLRDAEVVQDRLAALCRATVHHAHVAVVRGEVGHGEDLGLGAAGDHARRGGRRLEVEANLVGVLLIARDTLQRQAAGRLEHGVGTLVVRVVPLAGRLPAHAREHLCAHIITARLNVYLHLAGSMHKGRRARALRGGARERGEDDGSGNLHGFARALRAKRRWQSRLQLGGGL